MAERTLDARSSVAFLRHRWPVLLAAGLAGAVLGVLYAVLVPLELTSQSLVMLPAAAQSVTGGGTDIDTQVRLVQSRPVLEEAGREVRPVLSGSQVAKKISADGATSQLIEILASSNRADQAEALSQAVAKAYVQIVTNNARSVTGATLGELRERELLLRKQIKALQDQIDATDRRKTREDAGSAAGRRDAQLAAQLTVDQAELSLQWEQVKKELAAGAAAGAASPAVIVQSGAPATGPGLLSYYLTSALLGALLAAALGAVVLLIRVRRDPRLRTRDDIADAVGSTVLADVRTRPQRSVAAWSTLFEFYEAPAVDAWAFRQVLRGLAASPERENWDARVAKRAPGRLEHPRSVTVVSLAGDARGLAVGAQLASFAASLGIATRFVAAGGHTNAPSLWAACSGDRAGRLRPGLVLDVGNDDHEADPPGRPLPPPSETLDDLLQGLLLRDSAESADDDVPPSITDGGSRWEPSEEPEDDLEDDLEDEPGDSTGGDDPEDGAGEDDPQDGTGEDDPQDGTEEDDPQDGAEDGTEEEDEPEDGSEDEPFRSDEESVAVAPAARGPELVPMTGTLAPEPAGQAAPRHVLADLTVVLAVADRRSPTLSRIPATAVTVLAISPGSATPEELARLAVAVDDADRRIDGIIIADPDPADATTGRRMLNERALEPPLPLRTTGVSRLPLAGGGRGRGR